jgi:hypothetical protein
VPDAASRRAVARRRRVVVAVSSGASFLAVFALSSNLLTIGSAGQEIF